VTPIIGMRLPSNFRSASKQRGLSSCRLLEQLGVRNEGSLRQRWVAKGGAVCGTAFYGLLREEWPPVRA